MINGEATGNANAIRQFLDYHGAKPGDIDGLLGRFGVFDDAAGMASHVGPGKLTAAEAAQIQAIANKYGTELYVVGSRAAGRGRLIETCLPKGKVLGKTRSDIDFRIDAEHPHALQIIEELRGVGVALARLSCDTTLITLPIDCAPRISISTRMVVDVRLPRDPQEATDQARRFRSSGCSFR